MKMKSRHPFHTPIATLLSLTAVLFFAACEGNSGQNITNDLTVTELGVSSETVHANHTIGITMGVLSDSALDQATVVVGLMESHDAGLSDRDKASLHSCALGRIVFRDLAADSALTVHEKFVVHEDCLKDGKATSFNLFSYVDPDDSTLEASLGAEDNNATVFNSDSLDETNNQACTTADGDVGCIFEIEVDINPGLDLSLTELKLESPALILYGPSDHEDVPDGEEEYNFPHIKADIAIALNGAIASDENALPNPTEILYDLCPVSSTTCADDDWMPLTIYSNDDKPSGHDRTETVDELFVNHPGYFSHELYLEGDTLTKVQGGGDWANFIEYTIRACVNTPRDAGYGLTSFTPITEAPAFAHDAQDSNNCKTINMYLVEPPSIVVKASKASAGPAAYSFDRSQKNFWGSHNKIGVSLDAGTANTLDFDGARSHTWAKSNLTGWLNISILDAHAKVNADVSIVGSSYDVKLAAFNQTLFSNARSIPEYHWSKKWSVSKRACATFSYGIYIVSLDVDVCASGKLGFDAGLSITAKEESGSGIFAEAAKIGSIDPAFKPYLNFDGSATAYVSAGIAKAGIEATIAILETSAPVTGYLRWGLNDEYNMVIEGNIELKLIYDTLNGKIYAFADVRKVSWCKKWGVPYPCGTHWHRVAKATLATWHGVSKTIILLNRYKQITLTL